METVAIKEASANYYWQLPIIIICYILWENSKAVYEFLYYFLVSGSVYGNGQDFWDHQSNASLSNLVTSVKDPSLGKHPTSEHTKLPLDLKLSTAKSASWNFG